MTVEQAKAAGYELIQASPFEVGLLYKGTGVRTWWAGDFQCRMPGLDAPEVQESIEANERYLEESAKLRNEA